MAETNATTSSTLEQHKHTRRNYKKELQQALAENSELKDKLLRTVAEFDNYRKRSANEKSELVDRANAALIGSILPVLDDLERFGGFDSAKIDFQTLHEGLALVAKNFKKILSDAGLVEMTAVGQPFDPQKHDALMQIEIKGQEPDMVAEQHLKGYEFKDQVLRHAKVIVTK